MAAGSFCFFSLYWYICILFAPHLRSDLFKGGIEACQPPGLMWSGQEESPVPCVLFEYLPVKLPVRVASECNTCINNARGDWR